MGNEVLTLSCETLTVLSLGLRHEHCNYDSKKSEREKKQKRGKKRTITHCRQLPLLS